MGFRDAPTILRALAASKCACSRRRSLRSAPFACRPMASALGIVPTTYGFFRNCPDADGGEPPQLTQTVVEGMASERNLSLSRTLKKTFPPNCRFPLDTIEKGRKIQPNGGRLWERVEHSISPVEAARANWVTWPNAQCNRIFAPPRDGLSGFPPFPDTR